LKQYNDLGLDILPGQSVRYIVTDIKSRNYSKRVIIPELANEYTRYDKGRYYLYLLKTAESILLPFGYSVEYLDEIIEKKVQTKLCSYGKV
jgi:DNA polymerase elongation subunit (family B)